MVLAIASANDVRLPAADLTTGDITATKLYTNGLSGTIPSSIGEITGLAYMPLGYNGLSSKILRSISKIPTGFFAMWFACNFSILLYLIFYKYDARHPVGAQRLCTAAIFRPWGGA
jgi:hypothetical protein